MNHRFLPNLNRRNTTVAELGEEPAHSNRRGSAPVVCQRCKKFEVDLTNTSDNLSATDAELKASRQVISLLQRQLELFQVEKEGLEKLIVSQSKHRLDWSKDVLPRLGEIETQCSSDSQNKNELQEPSADCDLKESQSPQEDVQKQLLSLIKTQLYSKDEEIVRLKSNLKEVQNAKEQLNVQVHLLEDDLAKLKTENTLLRENLALRDQTIVSLSNEVFEQTGAGINEANENHRARRQSSAEAFSSHATAQVRRINNDFQHRNEIAKLNDTLEAYKKTNELLGQNVLKLTDKCAQSEKREMESKSQAQELEARCCQIQSKLLSLLKEIEQSTSKQQTPEENSTSQSPCDNSIHSESVKQLIKRLLEDKSLDIPLSWKEGNKTKSRAGNDKQRDSRASLECDELGFYISPDLSLTNLSGHSSPVNSLLQKARATKLRRGVSEGGACLERLDEVNEAADDVQYQSIDSAKTDETSWRLKWDEFIKDFDKINLHKSSEFKLLLRSGVPQEYRCKIWKALIDLKVGKDRQQYGLDYYQSLLEPKSAKALNTKQHINPSSKQIELDLLRTLPNNRYFETIESPGTVRLRRVLNAFAVHKPEVGYCQGMNRLAAVALLVLPEEEAFWCLVSILEKIMPSGYYNDLWLAQVDSNVVMDFVGVLMPCLADHFHANGIELSLFAWFLTIFVDGTQPAFFLRLWDCFLYEGDKIMFRVALALLKINEDVLLNLNSSVSVNNFLRSRVSTLMDIDDTFRVAFDSINPLPGSRVRAKRESHFQSMKTIMRDHGGSSKSKEKTEEDTTHDDDDDSDNDEQCRTKGSSIISV